MGMEIIEGRNFSRSFGSDSLGMILNEAAVKSTGFKDPIGKKIYTTFGPNEPMIPYTVHQFRILQVI